MQLLPERAIWWPAQHAVILSDLHWGKSAHFRKHGIPMPGATQRHDAERLAFVVRHYGARKLIIAGDLFHSRHNSEVEDFRHWRDAHDELDIIFIRGNHDILQPAFYDALLLVVYEEGFDVGPFYIAHDDVRKAGTYTIHGHLHPGVAIPGLGGSGRTLPAFCIGTHALILPAFGRFTGCKRVEPAHFKSVFVIGEDRVMRLK